MWRRWKSRWWIFKHSGDALNRRVKVERYLWDAVGGKQPLPDKEKCREMALTLGIPTEYRNDRAMARHR